MKLIPKDKIIPNRICIPKKTSDWLPVMFLLHEAVKDKMCSQYIKDSIVEQFQSEDKK